MPEFNRIIDYIIDQANKYDSKNLQYEQDILFTISTERDKLLSRIISTCIGFNSAVGMQQILTNTEKYLNSFYHTVSILLNDRFNEYYNIGKTQTYDLITIGNEVSRKYSVGIKETEFIHGSKSIEFLRDYSFELMKGYNQEILSKMRSQLGDLLLRNNTSKTAVRESVEKVLKVNRSKAEEITQTELSRAFNFGVIDELEEYQAMNPDTTIKKYWHGFKYSEVTCTYCRPRIGETYDLYDDTETLPAHVRCRCIWLPIMDGWDEPVSTSLISRANMLNTGYSPEMIYNRINTRLGINYAEYIDTDTASKYIDGNRTPDVMKKFEIARNNAISDTKSKFDIAADLSNAKMAKEFNTQMGFWKQLCSQAIIDNDNDLLDRSHEAIKGVMLLPWNAYQLDKWNKLLSSIDGR